MSPDSDSDDYVSERRRSRDRDPRDRSKSPDARDRAKRVSKKAKEKVGRRRSSSCPDIEDFARDYADLRNSSKQKFNWRDLPEVPQDMRSDVRKYARENELIPHVPMVTVKDRDDGNIKCPIFPPKTIIAEVILPKAMWDDDDYTQFKHLDAHVAENMKKELPGFDPDTRMYNGKKYTWHHHHEAGKMQLVENGIHSATQHSGGREIWAAKRE